MAAKWAVGTLARYYYPFAEARAPEDRRLLNAAMEYIRQHPDDPGTESLVPGCSLSSRPYMGEELDDAQLVVICRRFVLIYRCEGRKPWLHCVAVDWYEAK